MTQAPSLRRQLALTLSLAVIAVWLLVIGITAFAVREEMDEVFDSAQRALAGRILSLSMAELSGGLVAVPVAPHRTYLNYVVRGADGRIMLQSQDGVEALFPGGPIDGFRDTDDQRIFSLTAQGITVEIAEPLAERGEAVRQTIAALMFPVFLLVPLSVAAVVITVRRALRPVDRLRSEVEARDGADLRPVTVQGLPQELAVIATEVNAMLGRLTRTLEAERAFTSNSAHELRTPIAASLAQTQLLILEAPPGPLSDRAQIIEGELRRLARLAEKLLQLARAEGGGSLQVQNMTPFVQAVVDDFWRGSLADRLQLTVPPDPVVALIDPDALAILMRNLIENADRHGAPGGKIMVALHEGGRLTVVNEGPVVAPAALARLTRRFQRGTASVSGAGLGLSIASTIAQAGGGALELFSPARGRNQGFEVEFRPATR
ncbi:MAG: ATP-binding protein [Gemmobacter sp.]|nr:ATP-binding protein [Gemmobacter sp.]